MTNALLLTQQQMMNAQWAGRGPYNYLLPFEHTNGTNFVVSANALTDPIYQDVRSTLEAGTVSDITTANYSSTSVTTFRPLINAKRVRIDADSKSYCFTAPASNIQQFELRPGDQGVSTDPVGNRHRTELNASTSQYGMTTLWGAFSLRVKQWGGFDVPGNFSICGQWHGVDPGAGRRPPFAFNINRKKLEIHTASSADLSGGDGVVYIRYQDSNNLPFDTVHNIVYRLDLGASGRVRLWQNGASTYDSGTIPLAYYLDASPLVYWQWGIYGGDVDHPDVVAAGGSTAMRTAYSIIQTANMEWGTTDLTDRILNPLAI